MSAKQVQQRGDTQSNLNAVTPVVREMAINITKGRAHVGDGITPGGHPQQNAMDAVTNFFNFAGVGNVGGTASAMEATLPFLLATYTAASAGFTFDFIPTNNNVGITTMEVNGRPAVTIKKMSGGVLVDLDDDDIVAGIITRLVHDGTYFQLQNAAPAAATVNDWELLATASGGGSSYDFTTEITADYKNYAFVIKRLIPSNDGVDLWARTRQTGNPSFDAGGSDYMYRTGNTIGGFLAATTASQILLAHNNIGGFPYLRNAANGGQGLNGRLMGYNLSEAYYTQFEGSIASYSTDAPPIFLSAGQRNSGAAAID
ncbi:MAG: hypothetical protein AB7H77_06980, partial [Bdellovibrionales bacterium]